MCVTCSELPVNISTVVYPVLFLKNCKKVQKLSEWGGKGNYMPFTICKIMNIIISKDYTFLEATRWAVSPKIKYVDNQTNTLQYKKLPF